jgi:predicted metallopeptidase
VLEEPVFGNAKPSRLTYLPVTGMQQAYVEELLNQSHRRVTDGRKKIVSSVILHIPA